MKLIASHPMTFISLAPASRHAISKLARSVAAACLLLCTSILPLPAFAAAATPSHSAVQPVPREDGTKARFAQLNDRTKENQGKVDLVFLGDSITEGWEGAGKEIWAERYAGRKALNLGIGGDRTQHVLYRIDHGNLDAIQPKVIVLMIGTNNSNGEDNTPGQIVDGITAIITRLREKLPSTKIILCAIFPRSENFTLQRGKLLQINQVIRKLADDQNVFWEDFGHRFVNPDGLIPRSLMPDFLHLSPEGYKIWAESMEPRLVQLLGEKAAAKDGGSAAAALGGEWIWKIIGPDGKPVEAPLILKVDGAKVTGQFQRGENGWLEIKNGTVQGDRFQWTVVRDRPNGGTMTYEMNGKLADGAIAGRVKTLMEGQPMEVDWSARRK